MTRLGLDEGHRELLGSTFAFPPWYIMKMRRNAYGNNSERGSKGYRVRASSLIFRCPWRLRRPAKRAAQPPNKSSDQVILQNHLPKSTRLTATKVKTADSLRLSQQRCQSSVHHYTYTVTFRQPKRSAIYVL
eukprot:6214223-Pleurochrysis_carterae.AAC.2